MIKKKLLLPLIVLFSLAFVPNISYADQVVHSSTWDEVCSDGKCTRILYSGVMNVWEDNQWKRIDEVKSLKDAWDVVYLEDDGNHIINIIDYNYTSLILDLSFIGNTSEYEIEDGKFKAKIKINETLFNETSGEFYENETEIEIEIEEGEETKFVYEGMPLGKKFKFGENSTTIILQDADTENLGDSKIHEVFPDTNYGTSTSLDIRWNLSTPGFRARSYLIFDTSSIPSNSKIENSQLSLYLYSAGDNNKYNISVYHVNNSVSWSETGITWNNQPCGVDFDNLSNCNLTSDSEITDDFDINNKWHNWTVTNALKRAFENNKINISFALKVTTEDPPVDINTGDKEFYSKESTTPSLRPYLNITYIPYVTINSNQTFNDSDAGYGQTILINANVTGERDVIAVYFNVTYSNGSSLLAFENGTRYEDDFWNSSEFTFDAYDWFNISIIATDGVTNTSSWWNHTVTLGDLTSSLSTYTFAKQARKPETFNTTISHDGNSNNTINVIINGNIANESLANESMFIFEWYFNETFNTTQQGFENQLMFNITAYANVSSGDYYGNISINRTEDNNITNITITASISSTGVADIHFIEKVFAMSSATGSATQTFNVYNDGLRNATNCNFSLVSSYAGTSTFNISNFDLYNQTSNINKSVLMTLSGTGSDSSANVKLECVATDAGGKDSDTISGSLSISTPVPPTPSGGGGGAGDRPYSFELFPFGRTPIGIPITISTCLGLNKSSEFVVSIRNNDDAAFEPKFSTSEGLEGIISFEWDGGRIQPNEIRNFKIIATAMPESDIGDSFDGLIFVKGGLTTETITATFTIESFCVSGIPFLDRMLDNFQKPFYIFESDQEDREPFIITWGMFLIAVGIITFYRYPNRKLITSIILLLILYFVP